jgi:hypothetical protein
MALPRLLPRPVVGRDDVVLADGKVVGRILQENTSGLPELPGAGRSHPSGRPRGA